MRVRGQSGTGSPASSRPTLDISPTPFVFLLWLATTQPSQNCHGLLTGSCLRLPVSVCVPHSSRVQLDSWLRYASASPSRRSACIDPLHSRSRPPSSSSSLLWWKSGHPAYSLCLECQPSPDSQPAVFLRALPCFYPKAASGKCLAGTFETYTIPVLHSSCSAFVFLLTLALTHFVLKCLFCLLSDNKILPRQRF